MRLRTVGPFPLVGWMLDPPRSYSSGLESDDSCEVSFKDALVFDGTKASDGSTTGENGVWERR